MPIKTFGLISALGTLLIYLVVFRILPNIVVRWDKRPWTNVRGSARLVDGIVSALFRFGIRQPALVIGMVCVLLAMGAPQLRNVMAETGSGEGDTVGQDDSRRCGPGIRIARGNGGTLAQCS